MRLLQHQAPQSNHKRPLQNAGPAAPKRGEATIDSGLECKKIVTRP